MSAFAPSRLSALIRIWLPVLAVVTVLTGCSGSPARSHASRRPGTELSASLVSPLNVRLTWRYSGLPPAGYMPEYATVHDGPFTILAFVPPGQHTYWHTKLMPQTTFYYRVVPYYGPASPPVRVNLPPGAYSNSANSHDQVWARPMTIATAPGMKASIRHQPTASAGAPATLRARVMNPNALRLTWTDHASDAQGYLIEIRPPGRPNFSVVEVVGPAVNSCGVITLEKHASYRVQAFYDGSPSNVLNRTTGEPPSS